MKPEARGRSRRALGVGPFITGWADEKDQLRSKLKTKAGRYGAPDRPFVIGVLMTSGLFRQTDAEEALYGSEGLSFWPETGEPHLHRRRDGFWVRRDGPQNRRVSAVLAGQTIFTSNVNRVTPELWLNPWADHPLPEDWWFPSFSVTDAGGPYRAGAGSVDPAALFELPDQWQPGPAFTRE